jgi:ArsR family transcriptional regulator, arsenate/arsenite/antimonite-responsive transcriptional repressor
MIVNMKNGSQHELLSQRFKALADPNRLRILEMLGRPGCCAIGKTAGMCACDIEAQLELSQPTISHHMKVLREAGLVEAEKIGQWMWYRRDEKALRELAGMLHRPS